HPARRPVALTLTGPTGHFVGPIRRIASPSGKAPGGANAYRAYGPFCWPDKAHCVAIRQGARWR
ncbi:TPA: hypothetical protein ACKFL0_004434, partial [Citrobacter koseri]